MKHTLAVMIVAGMAGAAWYRVDQPRKPVAKLQIPDIGFDEDAASSSAPEWEPLEVDLFAPVERMPSDLIAEGTPKIQTVSDEQPFAVSEGFDEEEPAAKKSSPARSDGFEPTEPAERSVTRRRAQADQSAEGRPISVRRIGQGRYRTAIITGLDGRDRSAVQWSDELIDALEARGDLLQQQEFAIIRAANPDGLAAKVRENANGVDLNRNFPTRRFRPSDAPSSGIGPASEPETRALLQTLYEFRPQRIVHLCSTSGKSGVYINQQASDVAERLQRHYGLSVERLNFDQLPGSVEEFTDATWNSSVVRLHLKGVPEDEVARKLLPVVLAAVSVRDTPAPRNGTVAPVSTPRKQPSQWQSGPQSSAVPVGPTRQSERRLRPIQRRGYEELPPPPQ